MYHMTSKATEETMQARLRIFLYFFYIIDTQVDKYQTLLLILPQFNQQVHDFNITYNTFVAIVCICELTESWLLSFFSSK